MSVLQKLYDSEINFSISTFWDGGFIAKIGDEMNGFIAQKTCMNMDDVESFLTESAVSLYPHSEFSKREKA